SLGRRLVNFTVSPEKGDHAYVLLFEPLRDVMVGLASLPRFPLTSRLFFQAALAHRLGEVSQASRDGIAPEQLIAELREIGRPEVLDMLHQKMEAASNTDDLPLVMVVRMLRAVT